MSITINRKIIVKSIVTPELKEELSKQINDSENHINTNISILNEKMHDKKNERIFPQINAELNKLNYQLQELLKKKSEVEGLDFGQEFYQGNIDSPVNIELGDNLFEKMSKGEIIVNNGEVVEFRNI